MQRGSQLRCELAVLSSSCCEQGDRIHATVYFCFVVEVPHRIRLESRARDAAVVGLLTRVTSALEEVQRIKVAVNNNMIQTMIALDNL